MTQATPNNYWISSTALHIERNALGLPDYIQASCVSGAVIMCHMKGIPGLDLDAGHNPRRWSLQASPTVFNTHTEREAAHKLNAFNCGWYKSNGEGGLFTFASNINAPSIPLWDQAIRHMNDVLRITNK